MAKCRLRNDPFRRIFSGVSAGPFTPGFRLAPSVSSNFLRPAAVSPPFGSFNGCFFLDVGMVNSSGGGR